MPHISVVIPVYKAEECLHVLYERLKDSLETITQDFEIIKLARTEYTPLLSLSDLSY
jgi:hypothetical protein